MVPLRSFLRSQQLCLSLLAPLFAAAFCSAQDIKLSVTYVCNGERMYVESCNIRDTSDTSTCQVAHPDRPQHNGFMAYTSETRGNLKKLLPACTQPTAADIAKQDAFQKKQQENYAAAVAKANPQPPPQAARPQSAATSLSAAQIPPPKNAEERAMRRCVSSGRLPSTCTGNSLLGAFGNMISSTVSSLTGTADPNRPNAPPDAGPNMAGVFQGAGSWRLDFIDGGVLVNCSFLSPNQQSYSLAFRNTGPVLTINTAPKPLVLSVHMDGTITGPPGPVTIDGVVASGYVSGTAGTGATQKDQYGNLYDAAGNRVPGSANTPGYSTFSKRTTTCPAISLTSKGAGVGVQTMETNLLKSAFGGDTGPATAPGIRMHGIFAAPSTGFSVQFFPESAVLGCGPDAARAYPYTVTATGSGAVIKIDAPDHPLSVAFRPDGSLDPGSGPYQVHGRIVTGQDDNDNFTFAPMERTCNLAVLTPSKDIPSTGSAAATMVATAASPAGGISTPTAQLGNATLSIVSGLTVQPGTPNPLAGHPYVLLRSSYADSLAKGGITVPPGVSPYKYVGIACGGPTKAVDCPRMIAAVNSSAASAARADANGSATLPGVPPGTYYLMISTSYNNKALVWGQAVQLKPGANSLTLSSDNATPLN